MPEELRNEYVIQKLWRAFQRMAQAFNLPAVERPTKFSPTQHASSQAPRYLAQIGAFPLV